MIMKTGVIGVGAMGGPMALNLHKVGYLCAVWNRTRAKSEALAAQAGVVIADTPAQLAEWVDLIITSVSRDSDLEEVIEAILPGIKPNTVVVDTSTVSADTARAIAQRLTQKGAQFLDCPVSGGVEGARNASLAMMVGGEAEVLEQVREPLSTIAATIVHMGPTGSGQATKAVNQIMAAGINQAVTEALAFGEAMGLDMDKVIEVVGSGAAANWFLSHRGKTMLAGRFEPGFKIALHHKDLLICRAMAVAKRNAPLPIVELTLQNYQQLINDGRGEEDISALFRIKRQQY
jgi:3-hydroxyisobutyrate dehydrogenase